MQDQIDFTERDNMLRKTASLTKTFRAIAVSLVVTAAAWTCFPGSALAQFAQPIAPPPPGDGNIPAPEIPGDTTVAPPVTSGTADNTPGTNFPTGNGQDRSVIRLYRQTAGGNLGTNRGQRMVQTIRPDTLSPDQAGQIAGILGVNFASGQPNTDVVVTDAQLQQIQQVLAPYPQTQNNGGRNQIVADNPAPGYPKAGEQNNYDFQGPLPTVRTFSRYLVILGVVSATIFMALAAYSMVLGHPYGGARVVGTAAGFMLLLMGYTIWKIVQMNTFNANTNLPPVFGQRQVNDQVNDAYMMNNAGTPVNPGGGGANGRSGIPVVPLGNAINPN
jgi:hypothetical protein